MKLIRFFTIRVLLVIAAALTLFASASNAQVVRQTNLYIDNGFGAFSVLQSLGAGTISFPAQIGSAALTTSAGITLFTGPAATHTWTYTLPDASATLAYLSGDQTFTGGLTINGGLTLGTPLGLSSGGSAVDNTAITQNYVFAGPGTGSSAGDATFRPLVAADIPPLSGTYLPLAGGTMAGNIAMNSNNITMGGGNISGGGIITATSIVGTGATSLTAGVNGAGGQKGSLVLDDGTNPGHAITIMPGAITSSYQLGIPGLANTTISSSNTTARMVLVESATGVGGQVLFFGPTSNTARTYWLPDQTDSMVTTSVLGNGVPGGTYLTATLTSLGLSGGGHVGRISTSLGQATAYTLPDPGAATATIAINTTAGVNSDITSLTGLTTALPVDEGGTGTTALGSLTSTTTGVTIGGTGNTVGSNITVDIATASATQDGLLSSGDWTTFNGKANAFTAGDLTTSTTGLTIVGGTGATVDASGATVDIATASGTQAGLLSSADWTTFNGKENAFTNGSLTSTTTGVTIGGTGNTVGSNITVDIATASATQDGLLSSGDWTTFNGKANAFTAGDLTTSTTGLTIVGGTGATVDASGATVDIATASGTQAGLLSSADWTTFNGKENAFTNGSLTSTTTGVTIGGTGNTVGSNITVDIATASATQDGLLSSGDWTTFNGKANAFTAGDLTTSTTGLTIVGGTGATVDASGATVDIATASGTQAGLLSSADWTTFNGKENAFTNGSLTSTTTGVTIGGTGNTVGSNITVDIATASATQDGLLSSGDWTTFNGKANAFTAGDLTTSTTGLTIVGGTGATVDASGATVDIATASGTQAGLLSSADWTTFNGKENAFTNGSLTSTTTGVTIGGSGNTVGSNITVDIATASATQDGLLSSGDWTTFNGKANAFTAGDLTTSTTGLTIVGGTGATVDASGATVDIATASGTQAGLLSSADWTTFNGKENAFTNGSLTSTTTGVTIGGTGNTVGSNITVDIATASATQDGLLSSGDWTTFNGKANAFTAGDLTTSTTGLTIVGGTGATVDASGATVDIATASGTQAGLLSSVDWTTFNGKENAFTNGSLTSTTTGVTIGGSGNTVGSNITVDIATASATQDGLLSSGDWTTFNGKANAFTAGDLTTSTTGLTIVGGTGATVDASGAKVDIATASGSQAGLLSSADWTTFNGKANSGTNSDITSLTGLTTALEVSEGGTGATTFTSNAILYGNSTSAIQALTPNATATNKFLTQSSANSGVPAWNTIQPGDISGVVLLAPTTVQTIQATTNDVVPLTIEDISGGSSDLQDWDDPTGATVLASIDASGDASFVKLTSTGNSTIATGGGTTNTFGASATLNTIGTSATTNTIGSEATGNNIGLDATVNNIGANDDVDGDIIATTTNIGKVSNGANANVNIGSIDNANTSSNVTINGYTDIENPATSTMTINTTSTAATQIGNTTGGTAITGATTITIPNPGPPSSANALTIDNESGNTGFDISANNWTVTQTGAATFSAGITLGNHLGPIQGVINLEDASGDAQGTLESAALGGTAQTWTLPDATGTIALQGNAGGATTDNTNAPDFSAATTSLLVSTYVGPPYAVTMTIPAATSGTTLTILWDKGDSSLTITPASGQILKGTSFVAPPNTQGATLVGYGTNWYVVGIY